MNTVTNTATANNTVSSADAQKAFQALADYAAQDATSGVQKGNTGTATQNVATAWSNHVNALDSSLLNTPTTGSTPTGTYSSEEEYRNAKNGGTKSDAEKENAYTPTPKTTSNPTSLPTTDGNTTSGNGTYTTQQTQTADTTPIYSDLDTAKPTAYTGTEIPNATAQQLSHVDTTNLQNILKQISDAATQQNNATIDNSVQNSINELNRALEDAGIQYDTQRNQIAAEERTAMDNQALYNQARGDNGGIGAAQYAAIQNNAATNRRSVNLAQTQLSTDTARQISDLRAQGEFEKADALLTTTQSYLSQLMSLEQWALETNMSVDEFNTQLQQWQDEYNMQVAQYKNELDLSQAQLTGYFANGTRTASAQNELSSALASSGSALLSAGIMPNTQQLEAMGMSESQAQSYISKV